MPASNSEPTGELLLRTLPLPGDTNSNGDIFGGWIMSQMDMAGSILAREVSKGRTVTVAVDSMKFIKPVKVGDIVCCYGELLRIGNTSLQIALEVWVKPVLREDVDTETRFKVTEAVFTYVAIDDSGRKRSVKSGRRAGADS